MLELVGSQADSLLRVAAGVRVVLARLFRTS